MNLQFMSASRKSVNCKFINLSIQLLRLFANICQNAAIDIEHMAVHKVRCTGCKEHRRALQVFDTAPATRRSAAYNERVKRVPRLAQRPCLRSGNVARPDAVHLNIVFGPLARQIFG